MNRRHLLNSAACLIPGGSILQVQPKTSFSVADTKLSVLYTQAVEAILTSQNDKVVLDLLLICLDRINWWGEVSEWRTRLFQVIDRMQSVAQGQGPESLALIMTAHRMHVTTDLSRVARTGNEESIIACALLYGDTFSLGLSVKNMK
jgi:hypothetical protein